MHKYPQNAKTSKLNVALVGARGYSGLELARLLLRHPTVQLTHCYATREFRLSDELMVAKAAEVTCLGEDQVLSTPAEIVFLATPAEVSLRLVPELIASGRRVIDLSGAFRLKKSAYPTWYGFPHTQEAALAEARYGLAPWSSPELSSARLVANPGCYATAVSMALIPLLKAGLIEARDIVIDAKSGATGAGRKAVEGQLFSEVAEECLPYRVGRHQHLPEIQETVAKFSGVAIEPHFVTHLLPVKRGIIAAIFTTAKTDKLEDIGAAFTSAYADYPLVRHGAFHDGQLARLKHVVGTPYTHISYELTGSKLYLFSTLDNLLKGAASQALENLNRMLDLPLTFGLMEEG